MSLFSDKFFLTDTDEISYKMILIIFLNMIFRKYFSYLISSSNINLRTNDLYMLILLTRL